MDDILSIFYILFFTVLMSLLPPLAQIRLYEIEPEKFKKVRIKYFSFLFRGIGGKGCVYGNVREYGVILPMFVFQLLGYILSILSCIAVPILYFVFELPLEISELIIFIVFGAECIGLVVVTVICIAKSKSKQLNS